MEYKSLPLEFTKWGFTFKQIAREGDIACYKQTKGEQVSYEVIRIRRHDGYTIAGNEIAPSEIYPSNEKWGDDGFTLTTKESAYKKMDWMAEVDRKMAKNPPKKKKRGRPKGSKNKKKVLQLD